MKTAQVMIDAVKERLAETERTGINELINWMDDNGFFEAPASGSYHNDFVGGLALHSLNVCVTAHNIAHAILNTIEYEEMKDSITIASLLHDLGKCGDYGKPMYVENILKTGQSAAKPYKHNKELLYIDHATRSLMIASRYIDLTEEEAHAIRYHDGLYVPENNSVKGNETQLYMIIHWADLWSSQILEEKVVVE